MRDTEGYTAERIGYWSDWVTASTGADWIERYVSLNPGFEFEAVADEPIRSDISSLNQRDEESQPDIGPESDVTEG